MSYKEEGLFSNLRCPKVQSIASFKGRLRSALILAHQKQTQVQFLDHLIDNFIKTMSPLQKTLALGTLTLVLVIGVAGIFGPSASSVAHAQAQETLNRAFARLANLSDEEKNALRERFQEGMHIKMKKGGDNGFLAFKDVSPEEIKKYHEKIKASLADALAEAKTASDVRIISADELPTEGFIGRAGRAFGFRMMQKAGDLEDKLANLPEDVRARIEKQKTLREDMSPVSFMVYTNTDGQVVYLGLNKNDEPVVLFIEPEDGKFIPSGRKMLFKLGKPTE